jgi:cytochrome c oxidase cbb3-type subunit III
MMILDRFAGRALFAALAFCTIAACQSETQQTPALEPEPDVPADGSTTLADPDEAQLARGQELYVQYCDFCHGDNGEGYLADNANALSNQNFLATASDEFLRSSIVHGRPGTPMSGWGQAASGPLDDAQVADLVAFIRNWQTVPSVELPDTTAVEGVATRGTGVYNARCASCHGADGEGVSAVSLNNPWFHAVASDGFMEHAIVNGRPGTTMAAYGDTLSPVAIADLVAYIRLWKRDPNAPPETPYTPDLANGVINPEGPAPSFVLREERFVPADQVKAAIDAGQRVMIMDARPTGDYRDGHITGALGLPFYELENWIDQLPRDTFIVTYCGCPHAVSGQALDALRAAGFTQNAILDEGYYVWVERGYGIVTGDAPGVPGQAGSGEGSGEGSGTP